MRGGRSKAGEKVLDVAAGNGNATLAAARRWCEVTSTDYVPALLERGRAAPSRRHDHGLRRGRRREAAVRRRLFRRRALDLRRDVHAKPGQGRPELLRVCRPKGQIGLANWTPDGFIGQVFKTSANICRRPPARNRQRCGARARDSARCSRPRGSIKAEPRMFEFRYRSARALPRSVPDLLRAGTEGVRGPRAGQTGRASQRSACADGG